MDFYVIVKIHDDLQEHNIDCEIQDIFKFISKEENLNKIEGQLTLASLLIHSLARCSHKTEEEISELFNTEKLEDILDIVNSFQSKFDYISKLFKKCMPKNNEESEFEDEDVYVSKKDAWDFAHMEYLWYTILKRSDDFYKTTPKSFFAQMEHYSKIHSKEKTQSL